MQHLNNKSLPETLLDWFERNPTAKARSAPLAKAIKVDATKVAAAQQEGKAQVVALVPLGTARRQTVKTPVWHQAGGKA